jgi:hypothetical protein
MGIFMKNDVRERIKKALAKDHACYVLITCKKAQADGRMDVELDYEGDEALAAYLIQGAQNYLEEEPLLGVN